MWMSSTPLGGWIVLFFREQLPPELQFFLDKLFRQAAGVGDEIPYPEGALPRICFLLVELIARLILLCPLSCLPLGLHKGFHHLVQFLFGAA